MFTTLVSGLSFTECPRWHDGRLYFSDFFTNRVLAVSPGGKIEVVASVPGRPAGLGFQPDGGLLIASMLDRQILCREPDGSLRQYADLSALAPGFLNDMLVDPEGRAWVGNFGFDLYGGAPACPTVLLCIDSDGTARVAAEGLGFPNGMALTPDGSTLIVAETLMNRLSAFRVIGGSLGARNTWASFGAAPSTTNVTEMIPQLAVAPDGICLDAEGAVWVADAFHPRLLRIAEGGEVLAELPTDGVPVFACMLGGHDGCTLFACVAPSFEPEQAAAHHRASIITTRVAVPRAGLP
ncbi:MAG TPA: SMP-30/gluconolactonase/LRE family protein [Bryobacteraceae bacterium]|nr:SMP-30/gluconolactonase/LRE family protein [Bryobacteraceae bacterium]